MSKTFKTVITQDDLERNPDLAGVVEVGEEISFEIGDIERLNMDNPSATGLTADGPGGPRPGDKNKA